MANDSTSDDAITTGLMLLGGGVAGFLGWRWLSARESKPGAPSSTSSARAPSLPSLPSSPSIATPVAAPSIPATTPTSPIATPRPTQTPTSAGPITSPDQLASAPAGDGPVTSPDQIPASSTPAAPRGSLPHHLDRIFDRYRGDVPIEYLRTLAHFESGMTVTARSKRSSARGLFQITKNVRLAYNKANGARYGATDLDNPEINTAIACWLLRFIATSYAKNHPAVPNLQTDWRNPRFVELLTFGWNAGFSEQGGVGATVGHLEQRGARDIDLELVHGHARAANAKETLSDPKRVAWAKRVAAFYLRERSLAHPIATPVA